MLKSLFALALFAAGLAPVPPDPPMRMGLWELTTTVTMSGPQMPSQTSHVVKSRSCVTPETWAGNFQTSNSTACQRSNESFSVGRYTADLSCGTRTTGHIDMNFSSHESGQGTVHMEINANGHQVVADSVVDMHFISNSCGTVQPGHPVIIQ